MAHIIIRGLDEDVKEKLVVLARQRGRSLEAEARAVLTQAVARDVNIGVALYRTSQGIEGAEVTIPERTTAARAVCLE